MAKRHPDKKNKKRRTNRPKSAADQPIADKLLAELQRYGAAQGNVVDLQAFRVVRDDLARLEADDEVTSEMDVVGNVYVRGLKLMTLIGNGLAEHPATRKLFDKTERAEEEYMPSGPPMSPITHSQFLQWSLFDIVQGIGRETVGSIVQALVAADPNTADLVGKLHRSRLGLYVQESEGGNRFRLRELVTNEIGEFACDSGYIGDVGNILLVRTFPPPTSRFSHGAILMTPYHILGPGEDAWLAYFDRVLPQLPMKDRVAAYEHLMKSGVGQLGERYWMEYIFEAYANHTDSTVFLEGLPDVASSRPHAEPSSPLSIQSRQESL